MNPCPLCYKSKDMDGSCHIYSCGELYMALKFKRQGSPWAYEALGRKKKGQMSPQITTARNRTSNVLNHRHRNRSDPPLELYRAQQLGPLWKKGWIIITSDGCRKRFFFSQIMYLIKLSWMKSVVLVLEFFILSQSWSDFKLSGIPIYAFVFAKNSMFFWWAQETKGLDV